MVAISLLSRSTTTITLLLTCFTTSNVQQEYWFDPEYQSVFEQVLGPYYDFITYQRPNAKADGLVVLLKKEGSLKLKHFKGFRFDTSGSRVALLIHLVEKRAGGDREVVLVNTHLTFPHGGMDKWSQLQQVKQIHQLLSEWPHPLPPGSLQIIAGDFNVERDDPVCLFLSHQGFEFGFSRDFVSHRNHLKQEVGVDHVVYRPVHAPFLLPPGSSSSRGGEGEEVEEDEWIPSLVSLVGKEEEEELAKVSACSSTSSSSKAEVVDAYVHPRDLPDATWESTFTISDHRPVTTIIRLTPKNTIITTTDPLPSP